MNVNQTISLSPDVISQEVSGETVLLDLKSENYFGLDAVGTRIWQLIRDNGDLQVILETILDEFDADEARIRGDLDALLSEIADLGLITVTDKA
jgi:hypothetical protein